MNTNRMTAISPALGGCSYVSPTVTIVEVASEGVLCMSGRIFEEWEEEDNSKIWGF